MKYELMYILDPKASDDEKTAAQADIKGLLEANGSTISSEDVWGVKPMAYRIKGSAEGFYVLYNLEMDGKIIKTVSKDFNLMQGLWRYMFVKIED